jgi:hypothetical protein
MAFCDKFRGRIRKALKGFDAFIEKYTGVALGITTKIKALINSPVADFVTGTIPGTLDDKILAKTRLALEYAVDSLGVIQCMNEAPTLEDKLECLQGYLGGLKKPARNAMLIKLASRITAELDDNRYPEHLYDMYAQGAYIATKPEGDLV